MILADYSRLILLPEGHETKVVRTTYYGVRNSGWEARLLRKAIQDLQQLQTADRFFNPLAACTVQRTMGAGLCRFFGIESILALPGPSGLSCHKDQVLGRRPEYLTIL
jgi:hypothetical protein